MLKSRLPKKSPILSKKSIKAKIREYFCIVIDEKHNSFNIKYSRYYP